MGKKGNKRKTRWRVLPICEDGEEVDSGQQAPRRPRSSFFKHSPQQQPQSPQSTFNDDEYTKITTPRQDVLFKKGYLGRMRSAPAPATVSTENLATKEAQIAEEGVASERCTLMNVPEESYVYTNGYVDHSNMYYMNGDGYELCNFTVLVGPTAAPAPVLAAIPCQPLPLQPLEWFNPPPPPAYLQCLPHMPSSSDSQNSGPQSSESPASPEECEEVVPCEEEQSYYQPHPPTYVYPGYMFGPPVFSMNGMTIQSGPPQPLPPSVLTMKHQKKKRRRRRHQGIADDGSEESSSYEKETEKPINQVDNESSKDCEFYNKSGTGSTNSIISPNVKEMEESSLTPNSCPLSPEINSDISANLNQEMEVNGDISERAGDDLICSMKTEINQESERASASSIDKLEVQLSAESDVAPTQEVISSPAERIPKSCIDLSDSNQSLHKTKTKHESEHNPAASLHGLNENLNSKRNKKLGKIVSQSGGNISASRSRKGLKIENSKGDVASRDNRTICTMPEEGYMGNKCDMECSDTTTSKKEHLKKSKLRKGNNNENKKSLLIESVRGSSSKVEQSEHTSADVHVNEEVGQDFDSEPKPSSNMLHSCQPNHRENPDAFNKPGFQEVIEKQIVPQDAWDNMSDGKILETTKTVTSRKIVSHETNILNEEGTERSLEGKSLLSSKHSKQKLSVKTPMTEETTNVKNCIDISRNSESHQHDQEGSYNHERKSDSSTEDQVNCIFVPTNNSKQEPLAHNVHKISDRSIQFLQPGTQPDRPQNNAQVNTANSVLNYAQSITDAILNDALNEVQRKHFQGLKIMEAVTKWLHTHSGEEILCLPELNSLPNISESDGETESTVVDEETTKPLVTGPKNVLCNPLLVSSLNVLILDDASIRVAIKNCDEFILPFIKLLKHHSDTKCDNAGKNGICSNYVNGLNPVCKVIIDSIRLDGSNGLKKLDPLNSIIPSMVSEVSSSINKLDKDDMLCFIENTENYIASETKCNLDNLPVRNDYSFETDTAEYEMEFDNWEGVSLKKQNIHTDTEFKMETSDNVSCMCDPSLFVGKYYSLGLPSERNYERCESQTDTESDESTDIMHNKTSGSEMAEDPRMAEILDSSISGDEAIDVIEAMNKNLDIFELSYLNYSNLNSGISESKNTEEREINFITASGVNLSKKGNVLHHDSAIIMRHLKEKGQFPFGGICCLIQ